MEILQTLGPLLGLVVGAMLTGLAALIRSRKERQRIVATALADLLEVLHRLTGMDQVVEKLRTHFGVQQSLLPELRSQLDSLIPIDPELDRRYSKAMSLLAEVDPVLAYLLRSKQVTPALLASIRVQAVAAGVDRAAMEELEATLRRHLIPNLIEAVNRLAKSHSWATYFRVRSLLAKRVTVPQGIDMMLQELAPTSISTVT